MRVENFENLESRLTLNFIYFMVSVLAESINQRGCNYLLSTFILTFIDVKFIGRLTGDIAQVHYTSPSSLNQIG